MRLPVTLAWLLLGMSLFTAGLLRQFHDRTPFSPWVPPVVGSLLFACILVLLLVMAWEFRRGAVPGPGVRLGSLTPILLMLFVEKWTSLVLYNPIFYWLAPSNAPESVLDARFRAFAGVGLAAVCLAIAPLSLPAARKTWRRARPARFAPAAVSAVAVVGGTYLLLAGLASSLGIGLRLEWPKPGSLLVWVLAGQAGLAFAEELYYRGLLMSEVERLAPRLGVRGAAARRWTALLATAGLFGLEHLRLTTSLDVVVRQFVFTLALGLLFGLLVMLSANLHFAAAIHAWINWLLLGAAPRYVDAAGRPALPSGTYIGLMLVLAFVSSLVVQRLRRRHGLRRQREPS